MQLTLSNGRVFEQVTESQLAQALTLLTEVDDFAILRDPVLGEIRAAGPDNGTFLVQCDATRPSGTLEAELCDVSTPDTLALFGHFVSGRSAWAPPFEVAASQAAKRIRTVAWAAGVLLLLGIGFLILRAV